MVDEFYAAGWRGVLRVIDQEVRDAEEMTKLHPTARARGVRNAWIKAQTAVAKEIIKHQTSQPAKNDVE